MKFQIKELGAKEVLTMVKLSRARIYKKGDKDKNIFFTLGIDVERDSLIYKLDYFHEKNSTLSNEQKSLCKKHIPETLKWNEIPDIELINWNWESLISFSVEFIANNDHHYDQLIDLVWGENEPKEVFNNSLSHKEFPLGGFDELPSLNPSFKGVKTDFIKKNINNKELGDAGEELVRDCEIKKLNLMGLNSLANKVKIIEDGKGYDILSFDKDGKEIYIEVKTTKGNEKTPFHLSINERLFSEKEVDTYCIYRLYNYNYENNNADYFIIKNPSEELLFQPTDFKIYLKRKS